jgi:hypothetical protein
VPLVWTWKPKPELMSLGKFKSSFWARRVPAAFLRRSIVSISPAGTAV